MNEPIVTLPTTDWPEFDRVRRRTDGVYEFGHDGRYIIVRLSDDALDEKATLVEVVDWAFKQAEHEQLAHLMCT